MEKYSNTSTCSYRDYSKDKSEKIPVQDRVDTIAKMLIKY